MKRIRIQDKNDSLKSNQDINFSIIKENKQLIRNESNEGTMNCIGCFSSIEFGTILYFIYLSTFIIGIIGVVNLKKWDDDPFQKREAWPLIMTILGFVLFGLSFIISFVRVLTSSITKSLRNLRNNRNQPLNEYIDSIKESTCELSVKCECYHETTSNSITTKHVTYTEELQIPITQCIDLSNPLTINELLELNSNSNNKYLGISFYRSWIPNDQESQYIIKSVVDYLTEKNEKKDTFFLIQLDFQYLDKKFKQHMLFPINHIINSNYIDNISSEPSFLFHHAWYILSLFLFMTLPYEIYFRSKIHKSKFTFIKSIKVSNSLTQTYDRMLSNNNSFQNSEYQPFSNEEIQYDESLKNKYFNQDISIDITNG